MTTPSGQPPLPDSLRDAAAQASGLAPAEVAHLAATAGGRRLVETVARLAEAGAEGERFRQLADCAPVLLWQTDRNGIVFMNGEYTRFVGRPLQELLGMRWAEALHPDEAADYLARFEAIAARRQRFEAEFRFRRHDGEYRWLQAVGVPRYAPDGSFIGYLGCALDITDLRRSRELLARSEERYRAFVANSTEGIWRMEFDPPVDTRLPVEEQVACMFRHGRFAECNEAFARMYGFTSPADVVGRGLELMMEPQAPETRAYLTALVQAGYRATELPSLEHDREGRPVWFSNSLTGVVEEGFLVRGWGTQRDISEAKRAQLALLQADRRKDEFLATLAHELRNPLAPIRTGLHLVRKAPDTPAAARAVDMMERQVAHMVRLIDDLMDVSRIARGRIELRRQRLDLRSALATAVEASAPHLQARQQVLEREIPDAPVWVEADDARITQAVNNLLVNSSKYSPLGGRVRLALHVEGKEAIVEVRDWGAGLPADRLEDAFEMFSPLNALLQRSQPGLGIGLALTRRLVELHGGRVWAESEGLERGAAFFIALPTAAAEPGARTDAEPGTPAAGPARLRVLVVDDNADAADALAASLEIAGHEVRTAYGGEQGLAAAASFVPDVAILDIGMPGMDGHELARRLRQLPATAKARLIALTGWGTPQDRQRSREAGFDAHATKPASAEEIEALLLAG